MLLALLDISLYIMNYKAIINKQPANYNKKNKTKTNFDSCCLIKITKSILSNYFTYSWIVLSIHFSIIMPIALLCLNISPYNGPDSKIIQNIWFFLISSMLSFYIDWLIWFFSPLPKFWLAIASKCKQEFKRPTPIIVRTLRAEDFLDLIDRSIKDF